MKSVLFASIIATIFVSGEAIKCYYSIEIDKPFNTSARLIPCLQEEDKCIKITITLGNKTNIFGHSCYSNELSLRRDIEQIRSKMKINNKTIDVSDEILNFCSYDSCNEVPTIRAVFSVVFPSFLLSIFSNY